MRFVRAHLANITGMCLVGFIYATRKELTDGFGGIDPLEWDPPIDDKVNTQWIVKAKDVRGTVVNVYAYKAQPPEDHEAYFSWHIGGYNKDAVGVLAVSFPEHDVRPT